MLVLLQLSGPAGRRATGDAWHALFNNHVLAGINRWGGGSFDSFVTIRRNSNSIFLSAKCQASHKLLEGGREKGKIAVNSSPLSLIGRIHTSAKASRLFRAALARSRVKRRKPCLKLPVSSQTIAGTRWYSFRSAPHQHHARKYDFSRLWGRNRLGHPSPPVSTYRHARIMQSSPFDAEYRAEHRHTDASSDGSPAHCL